MNALFFFVKTITTFYVMILLLRIWMQCVRADFYNPLAQFVVKVTQPVVAPLRRIIPSIGPIDTASLVIAYCVATINIMFLFASFGMAFFDFRALYLAALFIVKAIGMLIFWLLLIRAILSWVSRGNHPAEFLLHQLTEPLMSPIRRVIPAMGGLDFSIMIIFFALYFLNQLAADIFGGIWLYLL